MNTLIGNQQRGTVGRQRQLSAQRRIAVAVLAVGLLIQLIAFGANGPLLSTGASVLNCLVALLVLIVLPPDATFWRRGTAILLLLLAVVIWGSIPVWGSIIPQVDVLAALHRQPAPDLALRGLASLLGGAAILISAGMVGYRRGLVKATMDWLVPVLMTTIMVGLLLRIDDTREIWGFAKSISGMRFTGTMLNANAFACVCAATTVLSLGRLQTHFRSSANSIYEHVLRPSICIFGIAMGIASCFMTGSRLVSFATALALLALLISDGPSRARLLTRGGALAVAAIVFSSGVAFALLDLSAIERLTTAHRDNLDRQMILAHYFDLARRAPLFGYGLSAFHEFNMLSLVTPLDAATFSYINAAHNLPVGLVLQGGWVYAALLMLCGSAMTVSIVIGHRLASGDPLSRSMLATLAIIMADSFIDIVLSVPAVAGLALVLAGLLWGRSMRRLADRPTAKLLNREIKP